MAPENTLSNPLPKIGSQVRCSSVTVNFSGSRCSGGVSVMQKSLTQMNIQLINVISDVAGETGQKILRAIVAGERDAQVLAADVGECQKPTK